MTQHQQQHSGSKYKKEMVIKEDHGTLTVYMDVYDVAKTFNVTCPAVFHALKKILMPGQRGAKGYVQDLQEAIDALKRAIDLAPEEEQKADSWKTPVLVNAGKHPEFIQEPITNDDEENERLRPKPQAKTQTDSTALPLRDDENGCWKVREIYVNETDAENRGKLIGYCVRWSIDDAEGRALQTQFYYAGKDGEPSLAWCQVAVESQAKMMNAKGKLPSDFSRLN